MTPTIYAKLMDARLEHPLAETRALVDAFFRPDGSFTAFSLELEEQLKKAYVAGILDGFAQGIAAAALEEALSSDEGIHNAFDANQWD